MEICIISSCTNNSCMLSFKLLPVYIFSNDWIKSMLEINWCWCGLGILLRNSKRSTYSRLAGSCLWNLSNSFFVTPNCFSCSVLDFLCSSVGWCLSSSLAIAARLSCSGSGTLRWTKKKNEWNVIHIVRNAAAALCITTRLVSTYKYWARWIICSWWRIEWILSGWAEVWVNIANVKSSMFLLSLRK